MLLVILGLSVNLGCCCVELRHGTVLGMISLLPFESFRFRDEDYYEYEIFPILSIAHT